MLNKVKLVLGTVVGWIVSYFLEVAQMFRDAQPTEAQQEATRQRREQERQQAEAKRQQQALASAKQTWFQNFSAYIAPCLQQELFSVAYESFSRMGVLQPLTLANIPYRVVSYNDRPFVNLRLARVEYTPIPKSSLDTIRDIAQAAITRDLENGDVEGYNRPYYYCGVPAIVVDRVRVDGPYLIFTLGETNTEAAVRRWQLQQAAQPLPTAPAVAFDDFC